MAYRTADVKDFGFYRLGEVELASSSGFKERSESRGSLRQAADGARPSPSASSSRSSSPVKDKVQEGSSVHVTTSEGHITAVQVQEPSPSLSPCRQAVSQTAASQALAPAPSSSPWKSWWGSSTSPALRTSTAATSCLDTRSTWRSWTRCWKWQNFKMEWNLFNPSNPEGLGRGTSSLTASCKFFKAPAPVPPEEPPPSPPAARRAPLIRAPPFPVAIGARDVAETASAVPPGPVARASKGTNEIHGPSPPSSGIQGAPRAGIERVCAFVDVIVARQARNVDDKSCVARTGATRMRFVLGLSPRAMCVDFWSSEA